MAFVPTPPGLPGIVGLFAFRPQTAGALNGVAEALLCDTSTSLAPGERELIASYVSQLNGTTYCQLLHGAVAAAHLGDRGRIEALWADGAPAEASPRLRALLGIAAAVTASPQGVTNELVAAARDAGVDDVALHDTVLLAAAFCMFNRYVDGLATSAPAAFDAYLERGAQRAALGYRAAITAVPGATQ